MAEKWAGEVVGRNTRDYRVMRVSCADALDLIRDPALQSGRPAGVPKFFWRDHDGLERYWPPKTAEGRLLDFGGDLLFRARV